MPNILLIDDEPVHADCIREELRELGHMVEYLQRVEEWVAWLTPGRFDVVLLDNGMPRMSGLDFLKEIKAHGVKTPVVMLTADATSDTAILANHRGVFGYVVKRGDYATLARTLDEIIRKAIELTRPPQEVHIPGQGSPPPADGPKLVGSSPRMMAVYSDIARYADSVESVLILGETGTGKELVAGALHSYSPRKDGPFVALNLTDVPATLLESELFGHVANCFPGAKLRKGMIEYAHGGTLFLDEIGELPLELQTRLLRVLECRTIRRIGGSEEIPVDFRLVSATNKNPRRLIREGKFREDVYYRLNTLEICLPPLRERREDIPELVDYFLSQKAAKVGRAKPNVNEEAWAKFQSYHWPGNIRELRNVVGRALARCRGPEVLQSSHIEFTPDDPDAPPGPAASPSGSMPRLPPANPNGSAGADPLRNADEVVAALRKAVDQAWDSGQPELWDFLRESLERELFRVAWERLKGNQTHIKDRLGVSPNTVSKRVKELKLRGTGERPSPVEDHSSSGEESGPDPG